MQNKTKILVVDDNVTLLEMLEDALNQQNYDVVTTNDGEKVINLFENFKPEIVLTDIVMPAVDGIELILELRKLSSNIKIIAMSGGNRGHADAYLHMAEKLGADKVIPKPFKISQLLEELDSLITT